MAHNCFIDYVRRDKYRTHHTAVNPESSPDPGDEPDWRAEKMLARQRLDVALGLLPAEQRDVFLLHEEGGLSLNDIAHVTGVNRETAKSRLRYAVGKLRVSMADPALQDRSG